MKENYRKLLLPKIMCILKESVKLHALHTVALLRLTNHCYALKVTPRLRVCPSYPSLIHAWAPT